MCSVPFEVSIIIKRYKIGAPEDPFAELEVSSQPAYIAVVCNEISAYISISVSSGV